VNIIAQGRSNVSVIKFYPDPEQDHLPPKDYERITELLGRAGLSGLPDYEGAIENAHLSLKPPIEIPGTIPNYIGPDGKPARHVIIDPNMLAHQLKRYTGEVAIVVITRTGAETPPRAEIADLTREI
jgi:hypothetical protein